MNRLPHWHSVRECSVVLKLVRESRSVVQRRLMFLGPYSSELIVINTVLRTRLMKTVLKAGLLALFFAHGIVQAKSFHIEIPAANDFALKQKLRFAKPGAELEHDFVGGLGRISSDGSVIFASRTLYFVNGQYSLPGSSVGKGMSDDGKVHLKPTEDTFALFLLDDIVKHSGNLPHEAFDFPPRPWPKGIRRPVAQGLASDGSFVIGEVLYDKTSELLLYKNKITGKGGTALADGQKSTFTSDAMWWTKADGFHVMKRPKGWRPDGVYRAIFASTNGNTLLGEIENNQEPWHNLQPVLINRKNNSARALGHPIDHPTSQSQPRLLSGDGKVAVVKASARDKKSMSHTEYFTWTEKQGYQLVKPIPETNSSEWKYDVLGLNQDGSIMVGVAGAWDSRKPALTGVGLVWVNGKAIKAQDYLKSKGIDLHGWEITRVSSISHDGKILGGNADGTYLKNVAWFANLGEKTWNFPVHNSTMTVREAAAFKPDMRKPGQPSVVAATDHAATSVKKTAQVTTSKKSSEKSPQLSSKSPEGIVRQTAMQDQAPATLEPTAWTVVGYWDYDGVDGQYLGEGVELIMQPGANGGQNWTAHLQLKAHQKLPARARSLWPVKMNIAQKKVCINVPGYPTYSAFVDLPQNSMDGVFMFQSCL